MRLTSTQIAARRASLLADINAAGGSNIRIRFFAGAIPPSADTAGVSPLFTTSHNPASIVSNKVTIPAPPSVTSGNSGTITWAQLLNAAGTIIGQLSVGTTGTPDILLSRLTIEVGERFIMGDAAITETYE